MVQDCSGQLTYEVRRHSEQGGRRRTGWLVIGAALLLTTPSMTIAQEAETKTAPAETGTQSAPTEAQAGPAESGTQAAPAEADTKAADAKAAAAESKPAPKKDYPDRFMIRGGWNYVFNADTNFSLNSASGIGTTIDFARNLGGQREDNLWRIDSLYRFNPRHSIGFSYYDVTRKGVRTIDEDITVRDRTFTAGGNVSSELNIKLYRFIYNYSFHHDEKVELAGSFGLYFANIGASLSSTLTCTGGPTCGTGATFTPGSTSSSLTVPLPSFGFLVNYHFTPRLMGTARFDWFYIETAQFKGAMTEAYFGLEYRLFKHFALGGAFDRLNIEADVDPKKGGGFSFENDWNTVFLYGSLYF